MQQRFSGAPLSEVDACFALCLEGLSCCTPGQVLPRLLRFLGSSIAHNSTLQRVVDKGCFPLGRYFGGNLRHLSIKEFDFVVKAAGDMVPRYG